MQASPFFSIVIPTYNRPRQLAACPTAIARVDYRQHRFEVIVVNDGGPPCDATIASFKDRLDLQLVTQPHAGPSARETAARRRRRARCSCSPMTIACPRQPGCLRWQTAARAPTVPWADAR